MTHPDPERRTNAPPGSERLLAGLTPEQAQAVTHGAGPLLLIAGPGAGKTRTLTGLSARGSARNPQPFARVMPALPGAVDGAPSRLATVCWQRQGRREEQRSAANSLKGAA